MVRGLNGSLNGLVIKYIKDTYPGCGGAAAFRITDGNGQTEWFGRVINPTTGKKNFIRPGSSMGGKYWLHENKEYDPEEPVYYCEGIINSLSLWDMGKQSVSVLTSKADPENIKLPAHLTKNMVLAFDNDPDGRNATKKWKKFYPDAKAILPPPGGDDWNDFIIKNGNDSCFEFEKKYVEFEAWGRMALSESAKEYAEIYNECFKHPIGLFEYDYCYWFSDEKSGRLSTYPVSNFKLSPVHFELDATDPDKADNSVRLKVKPKSGKPTEFVMNLSELSTPGPLKSLFLRRCRVLWTGEKSATDGLIRKILDSNIAIVRKLIHLGYDRESECYVFPHYMIDKNGMMQKPKKGLFKLSGNDYIRPVKDIQTIAPKEFDIKIAYEAICEAWPGNGAIAVAWSFASLFVNQIKKELGFFPHLSLWDDSQTGKSTLALTIARMMGRDREGIPITKHANPRGVVRNIGIISGAPIALLEAGLSSKMDLSDFVLTTYGQSILQTRAKFTNDLQTNDIEMLAALMFVQNIEPFYTKPEKERVVSLRFEKKIMNDDTFEGFKKIKSISTSELAWFIPYVMSHRKKIEEIWLHKHEKYKRYLAKKIDDNRLVENHAIIMAFHEILSGILKTEVKISETIYDIIVEKWRECTGKNETVADHFFNTIDNLSQTNEYDNAIHYEGDKLFLNLPACIREMQRQGYSMRSTIGELQNSLRIHPSFLKANTTHRFRKISPGGVETKARSSWMFRADKIVVKSQDQE